MKAKSFYQGIIWEKGDIKMLAYDFSYGWTASVLIVVFLILFILGIII
ncbi:MAG: hypothetical protein GX351_11255 [Peptococcaceae bacterium]|nr:hypothetical protein [Peptococcaceae bacterium]